MEGEERFEYEERSEEGDLREIMSHLPTVH